MKKNIKLLAFLTGMCLMMFASIFMLGNKPEEKISKLGKYKGYSSPIYNEWIRTSQYVAVRDGTKLAVDIYRPAKDGKPINEPLPLIWTHTRYHRAYVDKDGKIKSMIDSPWLQKILKHGYVVASVDLRGTGASYGTRRGSFTPEEALDGYDITEWFAKQPWCDGNIGMYGGSYLGITQLLTAGTGPPHLKAIIPSVAMFDVYSFTYPGGIYQDDFIKEWSGLVKKLDQEIPAAHVDEDSKFILIKEALLQHKNNIYANDYASINQYRDSLIEGTKIQPCLEWSPHTYYKGINEKGSHTAIYYVSGWYDIWPRDSLTWFNNLKNPQKIIITPWPHSGRSTQGWVKTVSPLIGFDFNFDITAEYLRWYDYWLKGIDNGIMDEPPISYFTIGAPEDKAWRTATQWPLSQERPTVFYFHKGPSGSVSSINDGLLKTKLPTSSSRNDDYTVDYSTSSGESTRWHNGRGREFEYPIMTSNDEKALTYTSLPLEEDIEITGHPVVNLWVSSTAEDGDFFVYLEEVDKSGSSRYITEGMLRASHRKLSHPPYNYIGLPYHRSFKEDILPLNPGEPTNLVFDLHPTSNIFNKGHRIRVTITCADQKSFYTPELSPPPTVTIYRSSQHASFISLPVISQVEEEIGESQFILIILVLLTIILAVIFLFYFLKSRQKNNLKV
ncbi:MAG: CocE/NonD family hydrolase [Candidatus Aminicenantes bacterium]|nr:CocE/NonD family hydrolase [Candidatus Aminicenantes bacterium]